MGFFQVAVSEARATIILAETTDAEKVAKVQTLLASVARVKIQSCDNPSHGFCLAHGFDVWVEFQWNLVISSLRGAIFLPAMVHAQLTCF
jgi:hypothetical protein